MSDILILTRAITREFRKYLRRSGLPKRTIGAYLPKILRDWVALPERSKQFKIEALTPSEWQEIETAIVSSYRSRWQTAAQKTRSRKKKSAEIMNANNKQLSLDI